MIRRLIDAAEARAREAVLRAVSERRRIHGIDVWIVNDGQFASTEALFRKVEDALGLVARYTPWRLGAMRRDFARILLVRQEGVRAMFDGVRNCSLDTYFVAKFTAEQVGSSIVHEGVHARLRRGGRTVPRDLIAWEERLCRKAEVGFGLRVPDGAAVVERARIALAGSDADIAPLAGDIRLRTRRPRSNGGFA
jgi:hypothetical protein